MIWLSWRQFRVQAIAAGAALVAVAIALAVTGPHLASLFDGSGLTTCRTRLRHGREQLHQPGAGQHDRADRSTAASSLHVPAVPALIGIFWGAPLVARELETGTFRLAWNQSVTRTRWTAGQARPRSAWPPWPLPDCSA